MFSRSEQVLRQLEALKLSAELRKQEFDAEERKSALLKLLQPRLP